MYPFHPDKWWMTETAWIEQQVALPSSQRIAAFPTYLDMQKAHCDYNGPLSCRLRLEKAWKAVHSTATNCTEGKLT